MFFQQKSFRVTKVIILTGEKNIIIYNPVKVSVEPIYGNVGFNDAPPGNYYKELNALGNAMSTINAYKILTQEGEFIQSPIDKTILYYNESPSL